MSKKVVVTGSRGIAAALVAQLSKKDYSIYLIGGEEQDCKTLAAQFPQVVGYSAIDIRDEELVVGAFDQGIKQLGGMDHVVSIVGGSGRSFGDGAIEDISKSAWNQTLDLNLTTAFLTAREAIKYFKNHGGGSLALTSSVLATSPSPEFFRTHAYAVAKGGINTLVKTLSAAYLMDSIRVNAVAPSLVATPMAARAAQNPEIAGFTKRKQPFAPNQLSADQVAAAYVYLIENQGVTGQIIEVDGGWSVNSGV
jgi:NAD(P)-dependent dehydrogenase (short-subunit alcohol dehydrogenase family)